VLTGSRPADPAASVAHGFAGRFGGAPDALVRAPGRVNLIGEHTDYNGGFVLPMGIDRAVWIALRRSRDRIVRVASLDYGEEVAFSLDALERKGTGWVEYLKGVAWVMEAEGHRLAGWEGVVAGDVPIGAGLSSSAALEVACARAFALVADLTWEPLRMALLAQRAENAWIGVNCGGMDQVISAIAVPGEASLIDCRSFESVNVPFPAGTAVAVLDTGTRRGLVTSEYNLRRRQCEDAARFFGVPALRDVSLSQVEEAVDRLDPAVARRARHVVTENARTVDAAAAMRQGDAHRLGELMNLSHCSLREDFEVSSPELDVMVEVARALPGCFGSRMTGGGFGGCAIALVDRSAADAFMERAAARYARATGLTPACYLTGASGGASVVLDPRCRRG
jgi:galactokinase